MQLIANEVILFEGIPKRKQQQEQQQQQEQEQEQQQEPSTTPSPTPPPLPLSLPQTTTPTSTLTPTPTPTPTKKLTKRPIKIKRHSNEQPINNKKIKKLNKRGQSSGLEILPTLEELCDKNGNLPNHLCLELQTANCNTFPGHLKRYRCSPCVAKTVGYICAFRYIREWVCERETPQVILGGPTFPSFNTSPTQLGYRYPEFPTEFNRLPTREDLEQLRQLLAKILLPEILIEMDWWKNNFDVKFVGRRIDLVTKCDYCSATLIGSAWLCVQCGAEACVRCFEILRAQTTNSSIKNKIQGGIPHLEWLKRLTKCTRLHQSHHDPKSHIKISHITLEELENLHQEMVLLLADQPPTNPLIDQTLSDVISPDLSSPYSLPSDLDRFIYRPESGHSEPYVKIHVDELEADPSLFDRLWSAGQMIVVTGMERRLELEWSPSFFTRLYPTEPCQRIDSNNSTSLASSTTVKEFFNEFEKNQQEEDEEEEPTNSKNRPVWKLRDWPPEVDFQLKFPQLFNDFQRAIPIPDVTTRFGIRNLAAHFPQNANVPDIGPKMYIAMKNSDQPGSHGSTVLHMDVADAINIQTYATKGKDGEEGSALWHLYHAKDSEKLRDFLYQYQALTLKTSVEAVKAHYDDPIHTTRIYINANMRKTLREEYGVTGWEVKQKPGEAIFIPAYTAHQVCNQSNCIKVAADFVSPQSIKRCIKLTEEFRLQNHEHYKPWREDLLQINQMLLYAFLSTARHVDQFKVKSIDKPNPNLT